MVQRKISRWIRYALLLFPLSILLLTLIGGELEGRTFVVDPEGNGDYTTIQEAIDASHPYDTIIVENGTYNGHINVTKPLTITGRSNETVIIDVMGLPCSMRPFGKRQWLLVWGETEGRWIPGRWVFPGDQRGKGDNEAKAKRMNVLKGVDCFIK